MQFLHWQVFLLAADQPNGVKLNRQYVKSKMEKSNVFELYSKTTNIVIEAIENLMSF